MSKLPENWLIIIQCITLLNLTILFSIPFILNRFLSIKDNKLPIGNYFKGSFFIILNWVIASLAFISFLQAFPDIHLNISLFEVSGIYIFSWGIGFIALFAPQGIGVSEYVISHLLNTNTNITTFTTFLVSFRVIILISDLTVWVLVKAFCTFSKIKN